MSESSPQRAGDPSRPHDAQPVPAGSLRALPEIALPPGSLVIADLHLDVADDESCARFVRWLHSVRGASALCVLGDLFDVWVGPAQADFGAAPRVLGALLELARGGTALHVVPGNRDFLLDARFERESGARLHTEGFVARCGGARAVFVHGDTLCTRDHAYLRLRRVLRSRAVQWAGPRVPLPISRAIARRMRRASSAAIARKAPDEKSIQESAVREVARAQHASLVVCGHAHEFKDVVLELGPRWIVLDAFGGARDLLRASPAGLEAASSAVRG